MKALLGACLMLFAVQAQADWLADDIEEIITNVRNVRSNVTNIRNTIEGNLSTTADDLKRQLDELKAHGVLVTTSVGEVLRWLDGNRDRFNEFKGGDCAAGTPCHEFRGQLRRLIGDFSTLSDRFPVVEQIGLGNGEFGERIIEVLPPFVLFGTQQLLDRVAGWQDIPLDLIDIFDEIGDPEAFEVSLRPGIAARQSVSAQNTGSSATPTQRFCEKRAYRVDNPVDPVRLNRIKMSTMALKTVVDVVGEFSPDDIGASVVGEGVYGVKTFVRSVFKGIKGAIEVIQASVETFGDNLQICRDRLREIESHLAACVPLIEYKQATGNAEAREFVSRKIDEIGISLPTAKARMHLNRADGLRRLYFYGDAYKSLCTAYQAIGEF